jgi:hypothetical protein
MPNNGIDPGTPNQTAYTDNGDGTISDVVTGLLWEKTPKGDAGIFPNVSSVAQAAAYCASLQLGGHSDWRLPSLIELVSIVDYAGFAPAADPTFFPSTPVPAYFVASTPVAGSPSAVWIMSTQDGSTTTLAPAPYKVRCVR